MENNISQSVILAKQLDKAGIEYTHIGDEFSLLCHKGEEKPSCYVNPEKGIFNCFSCGAHGNMDAFLQLYGLVKTDRGLLNEVKALVRSASEKAAEALKEVQRFDERQLWACKKLVECNRRFRRYLSTRDIGRREISRYHILACEHPGSRLYNRVVFPCFRKSTIVGYIARTIEDDVFPTYLYPRGFDKKGYLWPIDSVRRMATVVLVEGAFDVIRVNQYLDGRTIQAREADVLAVLGGGKFTVEQSDLLHDMGVKNLITLFDNDTAGGKLRNSVNSISSEDFRVYNADSRVMDGSDPGSSSLRSIGVALKSVSRVVPEVLKELNAKLYPACDDASIQ